MQFLRHRGFDVMKYKLAFVRSSHRRCSVKKVFSKTSQISQENTCAGVSSSKETATQVFSCEIYKIFKNMYFEEHMRTTASIL